MAGPFYPAWQPAGQAPGFVRLLFLLDKNSLFITFWTLLRLATAFFFITAFFANPDRHTTLLSFKDEYSHF